MGGTGVYLSVIKLLVTQKKHRGDTEVHRDDYLNDYQSGRKWSSCRKHF